jgi:hypothetical protein
MKKKFYFRRPSQYSFDMVVNINDAQHEANFIASMVRNGYEVVDTETYRAECAMFFQFRNQRLSLGGSKY